MSIYGMVDLSMGSWGISLGYLLVRQGAKNSARLFLPRMPPMTVSGTAMTTHRTVSRMIVPKGSAVVVWGAVRGFVSQVFGWVLGSIGRLGWRRCSRALLFNNL